MRSWTVVAVALVVALAGCGPPTPEEIGADADTVAQDTLTACVTPTPRLVVPVDGGGYEGYDVEALTAVAEALGLSLAVAEVPFDEIVSGVAVNSGRCDIGAAGIVADPSLDAIVALTVPYRDVDRLVAALPDTAGDDVAVMTVGIEEAGPAVDALDQLEAEEVVTAPSLPDLLRLAETGAVDAVLVPATQIADLSDALGEVRVVERVPTGDRSVMVLSTGTDDLFAGVVDDALTTFAEGPAGERAARRWLDG